MRHSVSATKRHILAISGVTPDRLDMTSSIILDDVIVNILLNNGLLFDLYEFRCTSEIAVVNKPKFLFADVRVHHT